MIVQCCICKVIEGLKCPKCGTFIPEEGPQAAVEVYENNKYLCTNVECQHWFQGKDGKYSHGYCRPCLNREMAKIPKKVPAFAFYLQ